MKTCKITKAMISIRSLFLFCCLFITTNAWANDPDMLELATTSGCFICHSVVADPDIPKPLAPSYQDIAARYQNNKGAFDRLLDTVLHGTIYKEQAWADQISMRFMPPNVNISRDNAAALVNWILTMPVATTADPGMTEYETMLALSTTSGCMSCHAVSPIPVRRTVPLAPSFREIAALYDGQAGAQAYLLDSTINGTINKPHVWQTVNMRFMPPNVALRKDDAQKLLDWILALEHDTIQLPKIIKSPLR